MYNSIHRKAVKLEETSIRLPVFRGSGVPFCHFKLLIMALEYINKASKWNYNGDFYCDIGTAIHSTLQKWSPRAKPNSILGNWKCSKCDIHLYGKLGPVECPKCYNNMEYEEFLLDFINCNAQGHCDGILLDTDYINKKFGEISPVKLQTLIYKTSSKIPAYILEYKSTGFWFIKNSSKPKIDHKIQASCYASCSKIALPKNYGILGLDVKGCIIKYVSRENPNLTSDDFKVTLTDDSIYENMCRIVNFTYKLVNNREKYIKKAFNFRPCQKWPSFYENCPNVELCRSYKLKSFNSDWKYVIENIPELKLNSLRLF